MNTTHVDAEIESQPECWQRAAELASSSAARLPRPGERVAVVGCGTSWFMAQAYATLREGHGQGETDAFAASEYPVGRRYDRVMAITRSGTTSEVVELLHDIGPHTPTLALTSNRATPVAELVGDVILLDFADEKSVVQSRFATSVLALLRSHLGDRLEPALEQVKRILSSPADDALTRYRQFVYLGQGWTVGLAHEMALKMREAALAWAESYPAMDYRHGPISLADPDGVVWFVGGTAPAGLIDEVRATGAYVVADQLDPLADLVRAQRLAVAAGLAKGLDPDRPRNLNRSVVLEES